MAKKLNAFTHRTEGFQDGDYLVGYRDTNIGGEARWSYSQIKEGISKFTKATVFITGMMDSSRGQSTDQTAFFISSDGLLWGVGYSDAGSLGMGKKGETVNIPNICVFYPELETNELVSKVFGMNDCVYALTSLGNVYAAGKNSAGSIGDGTTVNSPYFKKITDLGPNASKTVTDLSCGLGARNTGEATVLALTNTGEVYGWGSNNAGQLGLNDITDRLSPVKVSATGKTAKQIAVSGPGQYAAAFILYTDGELYSAGYNGSGNLGRTISSNNNRVFGLVTASVDKMWVFGSNSDAKIYIRKTDNTIWSFGDTSGHEETLGHSTFTGPAPKQITTLNPSGSDKIEEIYGVGNDAFSAFYGKFTNNTYYYWGYYNFGNFGTGTSSATRIAPTLLSLNITGGLSNFNDVIDIQFATGSYNSDPTAPAEYRDNITTFVLLSNGEIYSCGYSHDSVPILGRPVENSNGIHSIFKKVYYSKRLGKAIKIYTTSNGLIKSGVGNRQKVYAVLDTGIVLGWGVQGSNSPIGTDSTGNTSRLLPQIVQIN